MDDMTPLNLFDKLRLPNPGSLAPEARQSGEYVDGCHGGIQQSAFCLKSHMPAVDAAL